MPSGRLASPHRHAYVEMCKALEAGGDYVVNSEARARKDNKKNLRAAQSFLWSQIPISAGSSSYVFNVQDGLFNVGNAGLLPSEKRLKLQDVFFTYALGFYLVCAKTGGGNVSYQFELMTFPSANFYGGGSPNLDTMVGLWTSGVLNVTVNGDTLTPAWDMGQHYYVPQTQIPANPTSNSPYFDQRDLSDDGWVVTEPNWIINGGNNNIYTVNYPNTFSQINLGTANWNLVMKWQGFLVQNASSIMDNATKKP